MIRFVKIVLLIFTFIISSCAEKQEKAFSILGSINPVENNYVILKQITDIEKKTSKLIDTVFLTNGKFKKGFDLEPHLYSLQFNSDKKIILAIDKGQQINIKVANDKTTVTGSKDTDLLLAYESFRAKSLDSLVKSVRRQVKKIEESEQPDKDKIAVLQLKEIENYKIHLDELNDFIKNNMGNSIALYATSIRWKGIKNLPFFDKLVTTFESEHPNTKIATKLREKVTRLKQTSIGGVATDIKMQSSDNKVINLYSVNKNYTLIDFWASWCAPCIKEIKKGYLYREKLIKNKNVEFLYFSIDKNQEKWREKVTELKEFGMDKNQYLIVENKNPFLRTFFNISSIPHYAILDNKNNVFLGNSPSPSDTIQFNNLIKKIEALELK